MSAHLDLPEMDSAEAVASLELEEPAARARAGKAAVAGFAAKAGPRKSGRGRRLLLAAAVLAAAVAAGAYYWFEVAPYESTDDAFIEADVTPIAPRVSGQVIRVLVADNQAVKRGDILFEIDPRDYQTKLDQARAELAAARGKVAEARAQYSAELAKVGEAKANIVAADAEARRAEADFRRYRDIGDLGVSASQLDLAATQARSSEAAAAVARNRQLAVEAETALDQAEIAAARAEALRSEAAVRQAELDLSYTRVAAPVAGFVTHRGVEPGLYAETGQPLLALVPRQAWVVANFKETQLARMRPGQPVELRVDAYPQFTFRGRVDSIQVGAGARFSLFPPENASGNYVKVVQRVPVKIDLDGGEGLPVLGPGMSVVPEVRVR